MDVLTQIFSVNLDNIPVMTRDRFIPRKEQAKLARELFKRLGIKGVSVTAPNYSMAQSVDVKVPTFLLEPNDFIFEGINHENLCFSDMPDRVPAKMKHLANWNAKNRIEEILLKAFPNHNDRSDLQSDYFDYKWSID